MKTVLIIIISIITILRVHANTYYVSPSGNDSNQGGEAEPWRTVQKAADFLTAGDTVFIKEGTYNERVIVSNSGTADNYIVFSNFQDDVVTIDGDTISWGGAWNGLFDVSDRNYIKIIGLRILNSNYGGIWADGSNNIVIKDNYTYNTFSCGIGVWNCSNIILEGNEVELACNDGEQECISISNSSNCKVFKNNVHDNGPGTNGGEGIDVKQGSYDINIYQNRVHHLNNRIGIYADAWDSHTYNINIYQNLVYSCGNNGMVVQSEMGGLIEYVNFYNNIVYGNKWDGIAVGSVTASDTVSSTPVQHIKIINNTLYKNGECDGGWGFGILIDNPDAKDIVVRNNICSENSAQIGIQHIDSEGTVDHNLLYGNNIAEGSVYGNDSIVENPLFTYASLNDFYLQSNSPAIDNGSVLDAPGIDFANTSRPYGDGIDIGAYEYDSTLSIGNIVNTDNIVNVYPNPVSEKISVAIKSNNYQDYTLRLFDSNGKLVRKISNVEVTNGVIIIDRDNLLSGLYVLNISNGNKVIKNKKLIFK